MFVACCISSVDGLTKRHRDKVTCMCGKLFHDSENHWKVKNKGKTPRAKMPVGFENGGFGIKYDPAYNNLSQEARTMFESRVSKMQMGMCEVPRVETPIC